LTARKLKGSTERFDATSHDTVEDVVMGLYHRYSYEVAARSLRPGDRVLDVGFGEGYGSTILGAEYTGVELDPELAVHAAERYAGRFETYDGRNLPDGPFELVVSFQVIEHVPEPDPWLAEIARVGRRAMFATPNRSHRLGDGRRPWNRYHIREYTADELQAQLAAYFAEVTVWGVRASAEIEGVELARYARAQKIARIDPLGIRYRLPPRADAWVRHRLRKPQATERTDFTLDEFRHSERDVEHSLVLLAEARNT
jgi:SAM-dependent methyltransferase